MARPDPVRIKGDFDAAAGAEPATKLESTVSVTGRHASLPLRLQSHV